MTDLPPPDDDTLPDDPLPDDPLNLATHIPQAGFSNSVELHTWLQAQPDEWAREWAVALTARSALRVLPLLNLAFESQLSDTIKFDLTASALRASFISAVAAKIPTADMSTAADAAVCAAYDAAFAADAVRAADVAVRAAARAADAAAFAADAVRAADAAAYAAYAADSAAFAADAADEIWQATSRDAQFLLGPPQSAAPILMAQPLWLAPRPDWVNPQWAKLQTHLTKANQDWDIWFGWYEAMLNGRSAFGLNETSIRRFQLQLGQQEDSFWNQDNQTINQAIKSMVLDLELSQMGPASGNPIWKNKKVYQHNSPESSLHDDTLGLEELHSVRDEMREIVKDVRLAAQTTNCDFSPANFLQITSDIIPDRLPSKTQLFALIRKETALLELRNKVADSWPDVSAARFSAIVDDFSNALDQFQTRLEFRKTQTIIDIRKNGTDVADQDIKNMVRAMRSNSGQQYFDESYPAVIDSISPENDDENSLIQAQADKLESISNGLKVFAKNADDDAAEIASKSVETNSRNLPDQGATSDFMDGVLEGKSETERAIGRKVGQFITYVGLMKAGALMLSQKYPSSFGWLERHLDKLNRS